MVHMMQTRQNWFLIMSDSFKVIYLTKKISLTTGYLKLN